MVANQETTCLGLEYFVFEGDQLWNSKDDDLVRLGGEELVTLGAILLQDERGIGMGETGPWAVS